jgi:hypothetical protein
MPPPREPGTRRHEIRLSPGEDHEEEAAKRSRTAEALSRLPAKPLMLVAVGLSARLNYEHGALLGYPLVGRVLFVAPSVLSGWLFELQLRSLRRERLYATGRIAKPVPQFGLIVWAFHPWPALRHLSRITAARLQSIPESVMDWEGAPAKVHELVAVPGEVVADPALLAAPVDLVDSEAEEDEAVDEQTPQDAQEAARMPAKAGRSRVLDELYLGKLRELVDEAGGRGALDPRGGTETGDRAGPGAAAHRRAECRAIQPRQRHG